MRNGSASDRMETYGSVKVRLTVISGMWRLSGMVGSWHGCVDRMMGRLVVCTFIYAGLSVSSSR